MKIIITGALGHIGSYLLREIPKVFRENEIILIDSIATQRYASLFNLPKEGRYKFLQEDVTEFNISSLISENDVVINLSAITDAEGSFDNPEALEKNNFYCTKKISEACLEKKGRLINLSSTSVYGDQSNLVDETCSSEDLNPQSPYAETKLKEEEFVTHLSVNSGLKASILRFGTIYGVSPGMRFHTAVNKFCWQASLGLPITAWKSAYKLKRPYLDLNDAVSAILFIIKRNLFEGEIYNVLTGNHSVEEVVSAIKVFREVKVDFVESKIMNQLSYEVSRRKIEDLGFQFSGSLENGIKETLEILNH